MNQIINEYQQERQLNEITKEFSCEYDGCKRSYTTLGNLKTHQKTHRGSLSKLKSIDRLEKNISFF